jgi:hypothetical protein
MLFPWNFLPSTWGFGNWLMPVTAPIGIALLEGSGRAFLFLVPFSASIGWSPPSCLAINIPCLPPSWPREHALALASATGINKAFEIKIEGIVGEDANPPPNHDADPGSALLDAILAR